MISRFSHSLPPPMLYVSLFVAVLDQEVDRGAVVVDEQPVADVLAVAVERQREVVDRVRDEERDQLLGILARRRSCSTRA